MNITDAGLFVDHSVAAVTSSELKSTPSTTFVGVAVFSFYHVGVTNFVGAMIENNYHHSIYNRNMIEIKIYDHLMIKIYDLEKDTFTYMYVKLKFLDVSVLYIYLT